MSILFVLLTFLLCIAISYLRDAKRRAVIDERTGVLSASPAVEIDRLRGLEIPAGYAFHLGHTWALDEGRQNARVGLDRLAATLFGKIDRIQVAGLGRWVRQGQKLMTVTGGDVSVNVVSPIEGMVLAANPKVLQDPNLVTQDPYGDGWILAIQSPDLLTNLRNLIRGAFVMPWMAQSLNSLSSIATSAVPAMAQDGGMPVPGLLAYLKPDVQQRLVREFFLS